MVRVNELRGIPGNNMEVVIFFVGSDRCTTTSDGSSTGGSSTGGSRGSGRRGQPKEEGPISVCLWKPVKCESRQNIRKSSKLHRRDIFFKRNCTDEIDLHTQTSSSVDVRPSATMPC